MTYSPKPPFPDWDHRRYFVDEAGDPTLFNKHGTPIIGEPGCSRYFVLGFAEIDQEEILNNKFINLRTDLLGDAKLNKLPSMQLSARKTMEQFHAVNDHPSIRSRVIDIICAHQFCFYAIIRDKKRVLSDLYATQRIVPNYRYSDNTLYDSMVERLFRDRLHAEHCSILFSRRGRSDRTEALIKALQAAQARFQERWNSPAGRPPIVRAADSRHSAGLQLTDYCLWALQRIITIGDDSLWRVLNPHAVEIVSLDHGPGLDGHAFNRLNPLTLESWRQAPGI